MTYADDQDAVTIANGTIYGLQAYVAGETGHAKRIASQIRAGRVVINQPVADSDAPFGGFKQSGSGASSAASGSTSTSNARRSSPANTSSNRSHLQPSRPT
jgi:aldehyde dehydrogenase (NAD+)